MSEGLDLSKTELLEQSRAELMERVREIPKGELETYGSLARELGFTARQVGGMMRSADEFAGVPWWRVVGAGGAILTDRIGHGIGNAQRELLEAEGIAFSPAGKAIFPKS